MIREEVATVHVVPSCTVFVRGSLGPHWALVAQMSRRLLHTVGGRRLTRYREGALAQWHGLPVECDDFDWLFDRLNADAGCRWLEVAAPEGENGMHLEVADLQPVCGVDRASYVQVRLSSRAASADIAPVAELAIEHLPIWWGSAGLVFHHVGGSPFPAHMRMAVLAKRYWGVQIQDMTALQWDALGGMPSVNWLTLVGDEFARSKDMSVEGLVADEASLKTAGIFQRRGANGVVLAAGQEPLYGDINVGEDLDAYVRLARRIEPLLLKEHTPLFGPFARPEVLGAWLGRLSAPQAWLECDIQNE